MPDFVNAFLAEYGELLAEGTLSTIVMVLVPTAISYVFGLALGVVLYLTAPGSLRPMPVLSAVLGWVVNILRSFPFIVLMVFIIPFTRVIMGTASGLAGIIPPLVLATTPFIARMVEQSLAEVPRESVEAVEARRAVEANRVRRVMLWDMAFSFGSRRDAGREAPLAR